MSQLIEFLGRVGSDANLRYGGRDALLQAMDAEGLDVAFRELVAMADTAAVQRTVAFQVVQMITDYQTTQMGTEFQPR